MDCLKRCFACCRGRVVDFDNQVNYQGREWSQADLNRDYFELLDEVTQGTLQGIADPNMSRDGVKKLRRWVNRFVHQHQ